MSKSQTTKVSFINKHQHFSGKPESISLLFFLVLFRFIWRGESQAIWGIISYVNIKY